MKVISAGTSIRGDYHIKDGTPCQDAHSIGSCNGWNYSIVSDGAGSYQKSHLGSRLAVEEMKSLTQALLEEMPELNLNHRKWALVSSKLFEKVRNRLKRTARKKRFRFEDLSCTLILLIHRMDQVYIAHIGDGRAGACINSKWQSVLDPVEGESEGSTCFLTTSFWKKPGYFQSRKFEGEISAVVAMSDGCERALWLIDRYDPSTKKYVAVNQPFSEILNYCINHILIPNSNNQHQLEKVYKAFIKEGNLALKNEPDDRTMILSHYKTD